MGLWSGLGQIGLASAGIAASPFSFGTSLALAAPALAGGVTDAFSGHGGGGSKSTSPELQSALADVTSSRKRVQAEGADLSGAGTDLAGPIVEYFKKLTGGDPSAVMQATLPERAKVIDQYDTARQAIAQFTPRGGGQTAALAQSRFNQASDISNITATARREGMSQGSQLATYLTSLGLSAEQIASGDLNTIINAILSKQGLDLTSRGQNLGVLSSTGEALGTLLGLYLTRGSGVRPGAPVNTAKAA